MIRFSLTFMPRLTAWTVAALVLIMVPSLGAQDNLVANGSFELGPDGNGRPDSWTTSGTAGMEQTLTLDVGPGGTRAAKLECTRFVSGSPASHAMACQIGHVTVKAGQWYRLTWRAKGRGMQINAVQVALSNTRNWSNSGLSYSFPVGRAWRDYAHVFRAEQDLPASDSRLQFWFTSTGTLWLADVALVPIAEQRYEYHPQIGTEGVTNFIPNSSFECGAAGWGSYYPDMSTWAGNIFRLIGEIDESEAFHGQRSMRVEIGKEKAPVFMWDWFDLVDEEILAPLVAHHGWVPLSKGETYVISCVLKADRPNVPARIMVRQCEHSHRNIVRVGTEWQRFSMTFRASEDFAWMGVGPDLTQTDLDAAKLWIDALQFEKAEIATDYEPRIEVESFIQTGVLGNTFCDPAEGLRVQIAASNSTTQDAVVRGTLEIANFFDEPVHVQQVSLPVKADEDAVRSFDGLVKGRTGFFRVAWLPQTIACCDTHET
ncbi:MAG: hypothetical protein JJ992_21605, partial [Planctomycetes bacterium]|nr:hypothetical protein [Planctomycetota bacterium]